MKKDRVEQSGFTITRVVMNQELATRLLASRDKQRPVNLRRVRKYADKMEAGKWDPQNPIGCMSCVSSEGHLLDSQHRLLAVASLDNVSIPWLLFENVDPNARLTMDQDGKPWSPGDLLGSRGVQNPNRVASVIRIVIAIDEGGYDSEPSREELVEAFELYQSEVGWAFGIPNMMRLQSPVIAAFVWAYSEIDDFREEIDALAHEVMDGSGTVGVSPSRLIRRLASLEVDPNVRNVRVLKSNNNVDRWATTLLTLRLIEAHLSGETVSRMPHFKERDQENHLLERLRDFRKKRIRRSTPTGGSKT